MIYVNHVAEPSWNWLRSRFLQSRESLFFYFIFKHAQACNVTVAIKAYWCMIAKSIEQDKTTVKKLKRSCRQRAKMIRSLHKNKQRQSINPYALNARSTVEIPGVQWIFFLWFHPALCWGPATHPVQISPPAPLGLHATPHLRLRPSNIVRLALSSSTFWLYFFRLRVKKADRPCTSYVRRSQQWKCLGKVRYKTIPYW